MNIPPASALNQAGASRAATRGGAREEQAAEEGKRKPNEVLQDAKGDGVDPGDQTSDRDGDGRQLWEQKQKEQSDATKDASGESDSSIDDIHTLDGGIDFHA